MHAGGVVVCSGRGCHVTFTDCTFRNCSLVVLDGARVTLSQPQFNGNVHNNNNNNNSNNGPLQTPVRGQGPLTPRGTNSPNSPSGSSTPSTSFASTPERLEVSLSRDTLSTLASTSASITLPLVSPHRAGTVGAPTGQALESGAGELLSLIHI